MSVSRDRTSGAGVKQTTTPLSRTFRVTTMLFNIEHERRR